MAQPLQLALDAPMPPPRVLSGEASDQVPDLGAHRWPADLTRMGPVSAQQQPPMPAKQRSGSDQPVGPDGCGQ